MEAAGERVDEVEGMSVSWRVWAGIELVAAAAFIAADLLVPTIFVLAMLAISLRRRRQHLVDVGVVPLVEPLRTAAVVLGLVVVWTVAQLALFMPVLEHLSGEIQDVSDLAEVEGDLALLLVLLLLTWTLAAVGEELVYRGYLFARVGDVVGSAAAGPLIAVLVTAVLFGLAHTEQGAVGVGATFLDGLFFGALRLRYRSIWAPVLAHGFNNTLGLVAFYFVGPITGWW